MAFTDFPNGLTSANDYLTNNISLDAQLSSSVANIGRFMVKPELDFTLREIICSLLAGRGLKLPNLQICISLNLKELLGIGALQQTLYDALAKLDQAFDRFMDHLKIDEVLGRINNVLGQISTIANMINFCSAPIDPIAIPNVLESAMESFLGKGKEIIDRLGTIIPDQIGGCLIDGFNCSVWSGGIMKTLGDNCNAVKTGTLDDSIIASIVAEIDDLIADIDDLIDRERNIATNYFQGGSDLAETPRPTNPGMGPLFNAEDEGIAQCETYANQLYNIHQATEGYVLTDTDGNSYQGPLSLICDDDLLRLLRQPPNPTPQIAEQVPVYNYCGQIVGYQQIESQADQETSVGLVPGSIDQPGFNAGGLSTNPTKEAQATNNLTTSSSTVINESIDNGFTVSTTTSDAVFIEIELDEGRPAPAANKSWFFTLVGVAKRQDTSITTAIKYEGMLVNNSGAVTLAGLTRSVINDLAATVNYDVSIDVIDGALRVRVKGDTGHDVNWTVKLEYVEA